MPAYVYQGHDLTTLVLAKVEHVVSLLAASTGETFDTVHRQFLGSGTCANLLDTSTLLWGESAEFIVDEYRRESAAQ